MSKESQGSVAILELPNKDLCMQRRSSDAPHCPGLLTLFGGHIKQGEKPLACMLRELNEETSLKIGRQIVTPLFEYATMLDGQEVVLSCFHVGIADGNFSVSEGAGSEAYSTENLLTRSDIADIDRGILERYLKAA